MKQSEYITASEIGDYVYCKRAWWLRFQGLSITTAAMKAGSIKHTNLEIFVRIIKKLILLTLVILVVALITFLVSLFL